MDGGVSEGVTLTVMVPSTGPVSARSRTRVVMVKFCALPADGVRVADASAAFTSATEPATVQTPMPGLNVEVAEPKVPVLSVPAKGSLSVSVAVTVSPVSTSTTTMSSSATAEPPCAAALVWVRFVAVGASFAGVTSRVMTPSAGPTPSASRMRVAIVTSRSQLASGVKAVAARAELTLATDPLTVQTPVPALKVEVADPYVPTERLPAAGLLSVRVAVIVSPTSASLTTISASATVPASSA